MKQTTYKCDLCGKTSESAIEYADLRIQWSAHKEYDPVIRKTITVENIETMCCGTCLASLKSHKPIVSETPPPAPFVFPTVPSYPSYPPAPTWPWDQVACQWGIGEPKCR